MASSTARKKRRKKRRGKKAGRSAALWIVILLLAVLGMLLLFRTAFRMGQAQRPVPEEPSPAVTQPLPPSTLDKDCFGWGNGFKTYSDGVLRARVGVDVSSHQEEIDWAAVSESGVDFAVIRAGFRGYGDGSTQQDEYFTRNMEGALANGLDVGVYFFSQALNPEEARAEAHEVLSMISGYDVRYPIYFDWEPIDGDEARTDTISARELTDCALAFCQVIEDAGYEAGIYFNLTMAIHYYHLTELKDYTFWLAEYQEVPSFPFAFSMWQYSDKGAVAGISTAVDLDLCFEREA